MPYFKLKDFDRAFWIKLGLSRLFDRDIHPRHSWEAEAKNRVISFVNTETSTAALDGVLKFEGVKDARRDGEKGNSTMLGALEKIPAGYFRKPRSLTNDGSIAPYEIGADDIEEYATSREGGEAHPQWREVIIERESAELFLKSQQKYLTQMLTATAVLPALERLTPCEAMTFIAFGVATPVNESGGITQTHEDDVLIFLAEQLVLEAAQIGAIKIFGKLNNCNEQPLPPDMFRKQVAFSTMSDDLSFVEIEDILAKQNWNNLSIEGNSYREWLKDVQQNFVAPDAKILFNRPLPQKELETTFQAYAKSPGADLTRDGILKWGKSVHGSRVKTTQLRKLYGLHAPLGGHTRGRKVKN